MVEKVSVLMPVKNAIPFLEECIESIHAQTYQNWELIAVDDHSSDDSYHYLKQWSENDARIQIRRNEGSGIIEALRQAYAQATGNYITRMDADDIMIQEKLEYMSRDLQSHGRGSLALGQVQYFSSGVLGDGYKKYAAWLNGLTREGNNFVEIYKECVIPSPCWMVHRDDLEMINGFKPNIYPEDYDLCFRFYAHGLKCVPSSSLLHQWRDHAQRTSRTSEVYADNRFLALKVGYFLSIDYKPENTLVIWGAGKKGKRVAQLLSNREIPFIWITNNSKKIGRSIYGQILKPEMALDNINGGQVLVLTASPSDQMEIRKKISELTCVKRIQTYFFC